MPEVRLDDVLNRPDDCRIAQACAKLGWYVIPLRPTDKRPALKDWPNRATTDVETILDWWDANGDFPGSKAGIVTGPRSGIWVLDVDVRSTANGYATLVDLLAQHGEVELPRTFTVRTPSGGRHYYFRYPTDGREIKNSSSRTLGPGLDSRGRNGQVLAPYTSNAGGVYEIIDGTAPVDAPDWLVDRLQPRPAAPPIEPGEVVGNDFIEHVMQAAAGRLAATRSPGRNDALNAAAFGLAGLGARGLLARAVAWAALREACQVNGLLDDPRDGEDACLATFNSGWDAGLVKEVSS